MTPSSSRRALIAAIAVASALVMARSAVFVVYRQSFFDSDQAIVGLMGKHLAEGRAFPLYFYGQTYMLGVDAWLAALVFLVTGPSVSALHAALTLESLAAAGLLVVALARDNGLRPSAAVLCLLPIAFAPPVTASLFVDGAATAAPFLYIAALWTLRRRPLWFGAIAAIGFLHREFVAYAIPALLLLEGLDRSLWNRARIGQWLVVGATALATMQVVQALKPYADFLGPGTRGQLLHGASGSNVGNLSERVDFVASEVPRRAIKMAVEHVPRILGGRFVELPVATQGHDWLRWPVLAVLFAFAVRATWLRVTGVDRTPLAGSCAAFMIAVGLVAAASYILTRSLESSVDRYLLLVLFVPAGLVAWIVSVDPSALVKRTAVGLVVVLALSSAADHARMAARYLSGGEPDDVPALVSALDARGGRVAIAGYWRAYKITFLADERVKIASSDFVRVEEYQHLAQAQGDRLQVLRDTPCAGEEVSPGWYLCGE
jgi:hypothetical protein